MPAFTLVGQLPSHIECFVDNSFTHLSTTQDFIPALWFGLVSYPGRAWGCTVLLESGAVFRNLPPHAIAFSKSPSPWQINCAQEWDCYGSDWTAIEYALLQEHRCAVRCGRLPGALNGEYLFTVAPVGDAWSAYPEQAKEFTFVRLDDPVSRLTIQPTNRIIFEDKAFTTNPKMAFPTDLVRQTQVWCCE